MKRYIKSFTTDQLKQQLGDNYPEGGYLYIFKHGIGPGTIPRDVQIVKTKDLPNDYTAVWLDRFLTTSELKEYDIPSETEINRYLDRISYCQKDGDVVPCDKVLCSTSLSEDRRHDAWVAYYKNIFPYLYDFKETKQATRLYNASFRTCLSSLPYSNPVLSRYWIYDGGWLLIYATPEFKVGIETLLPQGPNGYPPRSTPEGTFQLFYEDSDGVTCKDYFSSLPELCDKVNELTQNKSAQYQPSWTYRLSDLYNKAFSNGIEACDKVTASTKPHPKIPEGWERVPEGDDDDGNWGTIAKALPDNQGYYWINVIEDEKGRRCFELEVGYRGDNGAIGQIWKAASKPFYRLGDIVKYAENKMRREYDEDIDACDKVEATTEPKYFANMVSCSSEDGYEQLAEGIPETSDYYDDPDHFKYYVAGYYDGNKRGLASSFDTDDFDAVLEGAHDMAAQGLTVVITNSETGIEVVYSPDVWMNAIDDGEYPSGVYSVM